MFPFKLSYVIYVMSILQHIKNREPPGSPFAVFRQLDYIGFPAVYNRFTVKKSAINS